MPHRLFHYNFPCRTMRNLQRIFRSIELPHYINHTSVVSVGIILSPIITMLVFLMNIDGVLERMGTGTGCLEKQVG